MKRLIGRLAVFYILPFALILLSSTSFALDAKARCVFLYRQSYSQCEKEGSYFNKEERDNQFTLCKKKIKKQRKKCFVTLDDSSLKKSETTNHNLKKIKPVEVNTKLAACNVEHMKASYQCQSQVYLKEQKQRRMAYYACMRPASSKMIQCLQKNISNKFDVPPLQKKILDNGALTSQMIENYQRQKEIAQLLNQNIPLFHRLVRLIHQQKSKQSFNDLNAIGIKLNDSVGLIKKAWLEKGDIYLSFDSIKIGGNLVLKILPRLTPRGSAFYECIPQVNKVNPDVLPGICKYPSNAPSII